MQSIYSIHVITKFGIWYDCMTSAAISYKAAHESFNLNDGRDTSMLEVAWVTFVGPFSIFATRAVISITTIGLPRWYYGFLLDYAGIVLPAIITFTLTQFTGLILLILLIVGVMSIVSPFVLARDRRERNKYVVACKPRH